MSDDDDLQVMLAEQRALAELGLHDLSMRWRQQPERHPVAFGEGLPLDQTLRGNPRDAFYGVAVLNTTRSTLTLTFSTGGAAGAALAIPSQKMLVWPAQYSDLSLSSDAAVGPVEVATVLKLRYPPAAPAMYTLADPVASAVTPGSPGTVAVGVASARAIAANPFRKGLSIVNPTKVSISLGLGHAAVLLRDIVLEPAGSWNGLVGPVLWRGEVTSIAAEAASLAIVEV